MRHRNLPPTSALLPRPRIDALFKSGLKHPIISVVAGPGYGKTSAASAFFSTAEVDLIWLRLTWTDNIPTRLWSNLAAAMRAELPDLAEGIEGLGFPQNYAHFDMLLRVLTATARNVRPVALVLDQFECIDNPEIVRFFSLLCEAGLPGLTLVFISNTPSVVAALEAGRLVNITHIGAQDLRFTPEETTALFAQHGLRASGSTLSFVEHKLEGWPLPVFLMAMRLGSEPGAERRHIEATQGGLFNLFEQKSFLRLAPGHQRLLVKLALLPDFTPGILKALLPEDVRGVERMLAENPFVALNSVKGVYAMQNLYKSFLLTKQHHVDPEDKMHVYSVAGDQFFAAGRTLEAIDLFQQCGRFDDMLAAILDFSKARMGISVRHAEHLMSKLEALPEDFRAGQPIVDYLRAGIFLNNLENERCMDTLKALEQRLLKDSGAAARELLGEVYILMAGLYMIANKTEFARCYEKACDCLPQGSRFEDKDVLRVENNENFSIEDNSPGALARMEAAVHRGVSWMSQVMHGGGAGMQYLYSAEAAYHTYDFARARELAMQAIHCAGEQNQHDILCNAYFLMARSARMVGDLAAMTENIQFIKDYVYHHDRIGLYDLRDYAESWLYLCLDDVDRMAGWIKAPHVLHPDQPLITVGRDRILYATYLLHVGEYQALFELTRRLEDQARRRGIWADRLRVLIYRAMALQRMNRPEQALDALWQAYDMAYHNGIITPFLESGQRLRPVLDLAGKSDRGFDSQWISELRRKGNAASKRFNLLINAYRQNERAAEGRVDLSPREREVLRLLARGLTREEIAQESMVSVSTVKAVLGTLYDKLGALNRADAVRIAARYGIID